MVWLAELGAAAKTLNPNGCAIALRHPLGCSRDRIMTTLLHHIRDQGIRYGPQTRCGVRPTPPSSSCSGDVAGYLMPVLLTSG